MLTRKNIFHSMLIGTLGIGLVLFCGTGSLAMLSPHTHHQMTMTQDTIPPMPCCDFNNAPQSPIHTAELTMPETRTTTKVFHGFILTLLFLIIKNYRSPSDTFSEQTQTILRRLQRQHSDTPLLRLFRLGILHPKIY